MGMCPLPNRKLVILCPANPAGHSRLSRKVRNTMEQTRKDFLMDRIDRCPFNRANGIRAAEVREGYARIEVELEEDSLNIWGVPHGGLLFAMADVASGLAAQSTHDGRTVTVSANVNFLTSSRGKRLTAIGRERKSGRSTGFYDVEITDDSGVLLLTGQYVMHFSHA